VAAKLAEYANEHCFGPRKHIIVPEAQHAKTGVLQFAGAHGIVMLLLRMMPTVKFDDEAPFETREVCDITCDRLLATKFEFGESATSK
jgi:hypothetical protein